MLALAAEADSDAERNNPGTDFGSLSITNVTIDGLTLPLMAADPAEVFRQPPASAKTGVWWHWMGTGVTREGIVRDLDWMQRMGVGLVQIFACADTCTPGPADLKGGPAPSLVGGTDDWWKLVRFATEEAVRRGIEVSAHNCPGYSHTGGTWTTPEHAMRDLVFEVEGEAPKPEAKRWVDKREIATVEAKGRRIRISHVAKPSFCSPTQRAATGYECDKMSPEAVNAHWDHVIGQVRRHLGPFVGKGFNALHMDSYEARKPSWTPKMREEFQTRRGYDPLPLLPVLGGFPVADEKTEKKFNADFDRTIADLYRDVVFRLSAERCHAAGLQLTLEPYSGPFVPKEVAPFADLLMTEFWLPATPWRAYDIPPAGRRWADLRGLKSDTHLKGATAPIVAAEAFTCFPTDADWRETPAKIKRTADLRYVMGINRFILHSVVLQPWGDGIKPGMSFGCWGTHFGRNQTWAEDGKGMFDYFNRCQALLQWGERGTDADCILGEPFGEIVRKAGDVRVRFVVNAAETNAAFNVSGEWFDAVRGTIGAPPATLVPGESGFLVTGRAGAAVQRPVPPPVPCATVRGPWRIFWKSAAPGADPAPIVTEDLFDWTTSTNECVRHFSGTATYRRTFDCVLPASVTALSVGTLRGNLAHVRLNGRDLGVVWCAPEHVAVPKGVLKEKGNVLEIDVTNVWANRLIGDEAYPPIADWKDATCIGLAIGQRPLAYPAFLQTGRLPSDTKRTSFSMWNYFTKESKLEPSGLIGPVELLTTADAAPPMLEPEVTVPNGGTLRFFPFGDFTRGVSGLSVHNFTVKDLASLKGVKRERGAHYLPGGLPIDRATYARGSRALGLIGYRFVLTDTCVERTTEAVRASFALTNIGASRLFHTYYALHLQVRDAAGQLIEDRRLTFDLRQLEPGTERRFAETFPSQTAEVALVIPDETGIEWPLTLSNRGRRADGSYALNGRRIKPTEFDIIANQ